MGVMACDRNGCEKIMCDRYSDEYGYLCYECFNELCETGATTDIETFMNTKKGIKNYKAAKARYEIEFPHNANYEGW